MLRENLLKIPGKVAEIAMRERCELMLLAGDLFDGPYTKESLQALREALEQVEIPVVITPGNHDFMGMSSPWDREIWPENVYIFTDSQVESMTIPSLSCRIYGAGFTGMDCPSLLEGFHASGTETYQIGVMHGDPTQTASPYNPVTRVQVEGSGLSYLALGHIHKAGSFWAGNTLCAWPGCPMGKGYDETGEKGVLIAELSQQTQIRFVSLPMPQFADISVKVQENPENTLNSLLPPVGNDYFYRVTLTGECEDFSVSGLQKTFSRFPNLQLRDKTCRPLDLWDHLGEDSFEGMYFSLLHKKTEEEPEAALLAARLSKFILSGQEVELP